jgi:hypothetical protein
MQTGYCTNVHAGADLDQVVANLKRFAIPVRQQFCPTEPLGIGLWLSASAARKLISDRRLPELAGWLGQSGLLPFTLNGFPYGDFHRDVVKHQVYLPAWHEKERTEYTRNLAAILHGLLPAGFEGSISTLPLAWATPEPPLEQLQQAATALARLAEHLARFEQETGRLIHIDLEPEPGCILQRSGDVVRFFEHYLLRPGRDEHLLRRHVRVCHDICHAAVMFEEQSDVLERYLSAGIAVGKIQVSSAVALDLDQAGATERAEALRQLAGFDEPRYLHQTVVCTWPLPAPWPRRPTPGASISTCPSTSTGSVICGRHSRPSASAWPLPASITSRNTLRWRRMPGAFFPRNCSNPI